MIRMLVPALALLAGCVAPFPAAAAPVGALRFHVAFPDTLGAGPVSGRLFVLLSADPGRDPLWGPYPDSPFFVRDVAGWHPGERVVVDAAAAGSPGPCDAVPAGKYAVRAVLDTNTVDHGSGWAPGNLLGARDSLVVEAGAATDVDLALARVLPPWDFAETDRLREEVLRSDLVSEALGRESMLAAAVLLPPGYADEPERLYPTVFVLPGWGSLRYSILWGDGQRRRYGMDDCGGEKIFVYLEHAVPGGYHGFADSENLGPWGRALVEEFLPHLESRYRMRRDRDGRFLAGQSSGGWGALQLIVRHPDVFGACWALSPDFVDFRSFGPGIDLYAPDANVYLDHEGAERLAAREADETVLIRTERQAVRREALTGEGNQLASFEAVFGPRGDDGRPRPLFDRDSGRVDPETVRAWTRCDLARILREDWPSLAPLLAGRIHVRAAADDPWFLDRGVALLAADASRLGMDIDVGVEPSGGHDLWTDDLRRTMHAAMDSLATLDSGGERP